MPADQFKEEEFTGKLTGEVFNRILSLLKPYWVRVIGFLLTIIIVSVLDAYFTYLGKQIVDQGILTGDNQMLYRIITRYGILILFQSASIFGFVQKARWMIESTPLFSIRSAIKGSRISSFLKL